MTPRARRNVYLRVALLEALSYLNATLQAHRLSLHVRMRRLRGTDGFHRINVTATVSARQISG